MQKIVIDTNIIISALISQGIPSKIISQLVFEHKVQLHLSNDIFKEYVEVLMRPKFRSIPNFQLNAEIVISRIEELAVQAEPTKKLSIIKDENDNRFLELALTVKADYLITGNSNDFTMDKIGRTRVVTPTFYWENCHPDREESE